MDKKTFLAVVLSMAVIFFYQFFLLPKPEPPSVDKKAAEDQVLPAQPSAQAPAVTSPVEVPSGELNQPPISVGKKTADLLALQEKAEARTITITTKLFQVSINTAGGFVSSWKLLDYQDAEGLPLEMVPKAHPGANLPLSVIFEDDSLTQSFSEGVYQVAGDEDLGPTRIQETLILSRIDESGLLVIKKMLFHDNSYLVDVSVEVKNLGPNTLNIPWKLNWGPGLGNEPAQRGRFYAGPITSKGGKIVKDKPKKDGELLEFSPGYQWIGLTDRYFLAAFIPSTEGSEPFIKRHDKETYSIGIGPRSNLLPSGVSASLGGTFFVGPKYLDLLKSYGLGLENALDFGWFGWLGKPMLEVLKFFNRYVRNWGLAIILLTFMVKFILFPITFNMYKSMRRMQEMQPQVQALKKKYKDDPQTLNQETMALYKTHKINPMGGCLPMVIQIPVFFALYKVLTIAIELRGAGFLHIQDLSIGETTLGQFIHGHLAFIPAGLLPIKILVILMGVTMFIQQRLSPTAGDPRQAKMMMFFPVILTAMFWNFSSGLVVYFLFSNVLAIGEQLLIKKWSSSAQPGEAPKITVEAKQLSSGKRASHKSPGKKRKGKK